MKIMAWRKAGELPADMPVMVLRHDGVKSTKDAVKFVKENPNKFEKDEYLEVIKSGKKFKLKETTQTSVVWKGEKDA